MFIFIRRVVTYCRQCLDQACERWQVLCYTLVMNSGNSITPLTTIQCFILIYQICCTQEITETHRHPVCYNFFNLLCPSELRVMTDLSAINLTYIKTCMRCLALNAQISQIIFCCFVVSLLRFFGSRL